MRPYNTKRDFLRLFNYLVSENIRPVDMVFDKDITWVDENGFYTYRIEDYPWLIHFYIEPEHRSYTTLYRMYQHFKDRVRGRFTQYAVTVPDDKPYIEKFVKLAGGKKYMRRDKMDFYYVKLDKGVQNG